ncbi:MAG: chemotaxis protein CheW [Kofleriaceae bacterium]|nr:chemotaxis protein CheW [Kofleriaceae bacterium]MBP6838398.1 chemotaxis protein CheW [Kofleriaceae bacterium]MBP9205611.1 chemotaxis protein CheW [Kofleriaceae bacterium]
MTDLRNVIVFAAGGVRQAMELRWVREVATLGFVTLVPTAPPGLVGVCNLHGTILPVLDAGLLTVGQAGAPARQGDGALILQLDGVATALRVDQVDEVVSAHSDGEVVVDGRGRRLPLVDPDQLLRRLHAPGPGPGPGPAGGPPP